MPEKYFVNVRNTFTNIIERVEVSKEVYEAYTRSLYRMRYNDRKFHGHETSISEWKDEDEVPEDDYACFASCEKDPLIQAVEQESHLRLLEIIDQLAPVMQRRFKMMYIQGIPQKQIARIEGVSLDAVKESLKDARKRIVKILEKMKEGENNG